MLRILTVIGMALVGATAMAEVSVDGIKLGQDCVKSVGLLGDFLEKTYNIPKDKSAEIMNAKDYTKNEPIDTIGSSLNGPTERKSGTNSTYQFKQNFNTEFTKKYSAGNSTYHSVLFCNNNKQTTAYFKSPKNLKGTEALASLKSKYGNETKTWSEFDFDELRSQTDSARCWHWDLVKYHQFVSQESGVIIFKGKIINSKCTPWKEAHEHYDARGKPLFPSEQSFVGKQFDDFEIAYFDVSTFEGVKKKMAEHKNGVVNKANTEAAQKKSDEHSKKKNALDGL